MRTTRSILKIRNLMIVIAALSLGLAMAAPMFRPMFAPRPKVAVAGPVVSLGMVPPMARGRQSWVVKNMGQGALQMWLEHQTDCGLAPCTFESASVVQADGRKSSTRGGRTRDLIVVGPGGQASIAMYWESRRTPGAINSYLDFGTNDPKQPRLRLALRGQIGP